MCVVNCERVSFWRIARGIYRGIFVKNDEQSRLKGGEFIGKKYCIRGEKMKRKKKQKRARKREREEKKIEGGREGEKEAERRNTSG